MSYKKSNLPGLKSFEKFLMKIRKFWKNSGVPVSQKCQKVPNLHRIPWFKIHYRQLITNSTNCLFDFVLHLSSDTRPKMPIYQTRVDFQVTKYPVHPSRVVYTRKLIKNYCFRAGLFRYPIPSPVPKNNPISRA